MTVEAPLDEIPLFVRAGPCLDLLPSNVDTLANVGDPPDRVHHSSIDESEYRRLCFTDTA